MKHKDLLKKFLYVFSFVSVGVLNSYAQLPNPPAGMVLVAGTDFTAPGYETNTYVGFDETQQEGLLNASFSTNVLRIDQDPNADGVAWDYKTGASDFHDTPHYAVTNNPIKLDSAAYMDMGVDNWYMVFSAPSGTGSLFTYKAEGFTPNTPVSVSVKFCRLIDTDGKIVGAQVNNGGICQYNPLQGKVKVNYKYQSDNVHGDKDLNISTVGDCQVVTITAKSNSKGVVEVEFEPNQLTVCSAYFIDYICIFGQVTPKISGVSEVCAGGENAPLYVESVYNGATYQWYKGNSPIAGATDLQYKHKSGDTKVSHTYYYIMTTPGGQTVKSEEIIVNDIICCPADAPGGKPKPRKLIWQDDFGTFTKAGSYWVWDYTDINEPQKVTKTVPTTAAYSNGWSYALPADVAPPNANFVGGTGSGYADGKGATRGQNGFTEGWYNVSANVTCIWGDKSGGAGTQWGWEAQCFNATNPGENGFVFVQDHTYECSDYGAMLFLNCGNDAGDVIYSRQINGLCDKRLTIKAYVNTFSGSPNPVSIQIEAIDMNDRNNTVKSNIVTRKAEKTARLGWDEVQLDIELTPSPDGGAGVEFNIRSLVGGETYNGQGNDLILDDIQIYACSEPTVDAYFDLTTLSKDGKSCKGDDLGVYVDVTDMIDGYYNGKQRYVFQFNKDASAKQKWETIGSIQADSYIKDLSQVFSNFATGDSIYFRVVLGDEATLQAYAGYYNPDDACAPYAVSAPIGALVECPTCTEPKDPVIASTGGKYVAAENTVYLCEGESTTLETVGSIAGEKDGAPYTDYKITWLNGSTVVSSAAAPATAAPALTVNYSEVTTAGVTYKVLVHDVFEDQAGSDECDKFATIIVKANPKPDKPSITIPNFCANTTAPTVADVQSQVQGYTINWKTDAGLAGVEPDFTTITPGTTASYYLSVTDATTGCVSDSASFTVTVDTIPSEVLTPIADFCEGDATAMLPTSANGYTVTWSGVTDLSQVKGATTPQNYTYTLTDPNTGCVSGDLPYTFTVMPIATLTLTVDSVCDKTTITATPVPATATVTWADASTDLVKEITDATQLIDYSATASLAGYCPSQPATVAANTLTLTQTPKGLTGGKVQYLKSDMATTVKNLVDQAAVNNEQAYSGQSAGTTLYWSAQLAQGTQPGSYTDITSTSVPTPAASNLTNTNDEFYSYWIYETTGGLLDCKSEMKEVQVSILGAPAPKVRDTVYCLNDVPVALDKLGTINQADASKSYELLWTTTKGAAGTTTVPDVSAITAAAGQTKFYVSQREVGTTNESSQMEIIIDVYEVLMPTAQDIETCKDVPVSLSATAVTNGTHQVADAGFVWYSDATATTGSPTAPTPDVSIVASTSYFVGQSYKLSSGQVCTGPKKEIVVKVNDTDAPAPGTVQFVAADGQSGAGAEEQFPSIVGPDKYVEEAGDYEYFYAEGTDATTKPDISAFSTTKPAPVYDKDQLNGGTKTLYYWVYRKNKTTGCPSEPSLITVNISDAMPPKVKDYYICQGEAVPNLKAEIQPLGSTPASDYSLIWYGTNPNGAGTPDDGSCEYASGQTSATAGVTTYYVAQKDNKTGAVSAAMPIKVTILANPVTTITTPPAAVCEQEVDLAATWSVTNVTDQLITGYLDGTTPLQTSKVAVSGAYTITNKYVNDYTAMNGISVSSQTDPGYCVGAPVTINVTIDTLSKPVISGSLTACPGIEELLTASAISNAGTINYTWAGAESGTGATIMGGTASSTKGQTFAYTVTATAGTCTETSDTHTITVGDGPVEGLMTATETDNSLSQFKFTDDNGGQERVVYACGNELTLEVNYNNTNSAANTEFTWYDGATSIGTGASIQIPATTTPASKTYEVKYFNKCAASAKVTVHFVPLGIDPALAEMPLTLCEGNQFNAKFEHNSSAILQPSIKWFKGGVEISGQTTNQFTIPSTTSADNGKYGFEISFKGCKESVTLYDLTVIPAISVKLPATPTICEGEEVDLEVTNIQPQGTTVSWEPDATIVSGENSSKATVKPTYTGGASHQAEYVYTAVAFNSICNSTEKYPVKVLVDEALSGSISGRNAICENESTTLNATAYDASTYTWKESGNVIAQSGVVTVKPATTTTYEVDMTRGKCSASDSYQVEVTTNPVIVSVDSVGIRDRQVITETGKGTAPFEFWVDENVASASVDDIFYGLTFTTHIAHVKDINGCQATYQFFIEPPKITIPEFFSPNGDGVNDNWIVGSLAEVYPDALVVIYDRFGKELIQFKGGDVNGWDGTYNGVPMPSTDYWYVIDIEEIDMQYSGHFTLLRQ